LFGPAAICTFVRFCLWPRHQPPRSRGGAIAEIVAAHYPDRLTSLVLTNYDAHDGWPVPQVLPMIERARAGTLAFQPLVDRPDLARERQRRLCAAVSLLPTEPAGRRGRRALSPARRVVTAAHRSPPELFNPRVEPFATSDVLCANEQRRRPRRSER